MVAISERATLNSDTRSLTLSRLESTQYDVLVIGGGVTGAGTALDAASRGLTVALVEMRDWAAGTSSRSGKMIHGGLRYLEQLNFKLVAEALRERGLMLQTLCPHLAKPLQFIYPFKHKYWERPYNGAGLVLYDTMGGAGAVPRHRHITLGTISKLAPDIDTTKIAGGATFYDVQMDDARHTVELVRTAAAEGADVASAAKVVGLVKEGTRVVGAEVEDLETGRTFTVRARHIVNATGVWTDELQDMAGGRPSFQVTASKGIHVMIPRDRIKSSISMFIRAEDSVLFVRTWGRYWLVGTTDTKWTENLDHPAATSTDVEYILRNLNSFLKSNLTVDDVEGVFAGLRPLVSGRAGATSKLSREHAIETVVPGFTTIAGGKYTTYRVMAKDVIDEVAKDLAGPVPACATEKLPTIGARGYERAGQRLREQAAELGLSQQQVDHLVGRFGALVEQMVPMIKDRPELAAAVEGADEYVAVEIVYAVDYEGALHIDDVLTRRTHIASETPDRGLAAAPFVASLMAGELGWDEARTAKEVEHYRARVAAELAAQQVPDDAGAMAIRGKVRDPRLEMADATGNK